MASSGAHPNGSAGVPSATPPRAESPTGNGSVLDDTTAGDSGAPGEEELSEAMKGVDLDTPTGLASEGGKVCGGFCFLRGEGGGGGGGVGQEGGGWRQRGVLAC